MKLTFKVHAVIQMEERGIEVTDVRSVLENGEDVETRPDEQPYPARLVMGMCSKGALHVAVRDNLRDGEIVVETAYWPDPALWEPGYRVRRRRS